MSKTINRKITLSFVAILICLIVAFVVTINYGLNVLFKRYANLQYERKIKNIVFQVKKLYIPEQDIFDMDALEVVGYAALQNGIILKLQSNDKNIDWDISTHNQEECNSMLQEYESRMRKKYPSFKGKYEEKSIEITYAGERVATLVFGHYGPYTLDNIELQLISMLNRLIVILGITFILITFFFGSYISRSLTKSIKRVVAATKTITHGNFGVHVVEESDIVEILELIESINVMSDTLKRKDLQKKRLTADIAHELRTPLSNLQSHMEAVIDGVWKPTTEMYLGFHEEILRLTKIVNQLQELSAYEDKKIPLMLEWFSINDFFDRLAILFSCTALEKGISITVCKVEESKKAYADEERILQCMINLISNALRYTPKGGNVTISYSETEKAYNFQVADTGIGISESDVTQIFERFYRADKSRNQQTGGMGIGLSITKAIVEMHGGKITVSSEYRKGSQFTIVLPKKTGEK